MPLQLPGGPRQNSFRAYWTGKNEHATAASRTALDHDLRVGDVLMMATYDHEQIGALKTVNSNNGSGAGNTVCTPTTASASIADTRLVVVTKVPDCVNELISAGVRKGGWIEVTDASDAVYIQVKKACTINDKLQMTTSGKTYLEGWTAGTVTQNDLHVGSTAGCFAVALQTVDRSALTNGGLVLCRIHRN